MSSIPGSDINCTTHTKLPFWYEVYPWKKVFVTKHIVQGTKAKIFQNLKQMGIKLNLVWLEA